MWKTPGTEGKGTRKGVYGTTRNFGDLKSTRATRQDRWKPITKGKRNSTPAIPTLTPAGASTISHIVKPEGRYYHFIQNRIEQAGCRTRKDSTRFVDTLITASPEFFKGNPPKEIQAFFRGAADFLINRVGKENIVSAVVHMDEKTPHLHLVFVPLTQDNAAVCKGDYWEQSQPHKVAGRFSRLYGGEISRLGAWEKVPARQAGSIFPPGCSAGGQSLQTGKSY